MEIRSFPVAGEPSSDGVAGPLELVCPAGSLPALKAAVDNGASCVYLGLRDATNARNFAGLNFDGAAIATGIRYAHERGCKVFGTNACLSATSARSVCSAPRIVRKACCG